MWWIIIVSKIFLLRDSTTKILPPSPRKLPAIWYYDMLLSCRQAIVSWWSIRGAEECDGSPSGRWNQRPDHLSCCSCSRVWLSWRDSFIWGEYQHHAKCTPYYVILRTELIRIFNTGLYHQWFFSICTVCTTLYLQQHCYDFSSKASQPMACTTSLRTSGPK